MLLVYLANVAAAGSASERYDGVTLPVAPTTMTTLACGLAATTVWTLTASAPVEVSSPIASARASFRIARPPCWPATNLPVRDKPRLTGLRALWSPYAVTRGTARQWVPSSQDLGVHWGV